MEGRTGDPQRREGRNSPARPAQQTTASGRSLPAVAAQAGENVARRWSTFSGWFNNAPIIKVRPVHLGNRIRLYLDITPLACVVFVVVLIASGLAADLIKVSRARDDLQVQCNREALNAASASGQAKAAAERRRGVAGASFARKADGSEYCVTRRYSDSITDRLGWEPMRTVEVRARREVRLGLAARLGIPAVCVECRALATRPRNSVNAVLCERVVPPA